MSRLIETTKNLQELQRFQTCKCPEAYQLSKITLCGVELLGVQGAAANRAHAISPCAKCQLLKATVIPLSGQNLYHNYIECIEEITNWASNALSLVVSPTQLSEIQSQFKNTLICMENDRITPQPYLSAVYA